MNTSEALRRFRIAIQPDSIIDFSGAIQSYSARWVELAEAMKVDARLVDLFRPDWLEQLKGVDGLIWRCGPSPHQRNLAKRLVTSLEQVSDVFVYPSSRTTWHLEDKLGQHYLLDAAGIPTPRTTVLWDRASALAYCESAAYPFVFKLSYGFRGSNVVLIKRKDEAKYYVEQMFGPGMVNLDYKPATVTRQFLRRARIAAEILRGGNPRTPSSKVELQHGYFYAQEFLPGNEFDTRVVVVGARAYAMRRRNRPDDFRASGSGSYELDDPEQNKEFVRLAFRVAETLGLDTVSIDGLRRNGQPVVGEIGSAYPLNPLSFSPAHWVLSGRAQDGQLEWVKGQARIEDAWFNDFLAKLALRPVRHSRG
jgi:glutathione synthase/RimK-type ligase-like ATP-grasp enzyme